MQILYSWIDKKHIFIVDSIVAGFSKDSNIWCDKNFKFSNFNALKIEQKLKLSPPIVDLEKDYIKHW